MTRPLCLVLMPFGQKPASSGRLIDRRRGNEGGEMGGRSQFFSWAICNIWIEGQTTVSLLAAIDRYCKDLGIDWTASCRDEAAIDFMEPFAPPFYKMASASLTDLPLLGKARATGRPLMISTGMSTLEEIRSAVEAVGATGKDGQSWLGCAVRTIQDESP